MAATEVYRLAGESELRVDSNSSNRQSVELCQQSLTTIDLFDELNLLTQNCGVWPDWQCPRLAVVYLFESLIELWKQFDRRHRRIRSSNLLRPSSLLASKAVDGAMPRSAAMARRVSPS